MTVCSAARNLSTIDVSVQPSAVIHCCERPYSPGHEQPEVETCAKNAYCKALPMLPKLPYTVSEPLSSQNMSEASL